MKHTYTPLQIKELQEAIQELQEQKNELLEACENALEAVFNLAPRYRERGCFNDKNENCPCTACLLKRAINKAEGK